MKAHPRAAVPNSEGSVQDEMEFDSLLRLAALSEALRALRRKSETSEDELDHAGPKENPAQEEIELRAYHIFLDRGGTHGNDLEDWMRAQQELRERAAARKRDR